jgi:transcriptional regulator GlxA family with amidase domain
MREERVQAFVRAAVKSARRVASVCSGAYVLAQAGVLDGKRCTTHWRRTPDFRERYPAALLEPDRIYTRDGKIWTSAGITAGIDLALALIADDLGEEVARKSAQELVVYHRRPGGQSQFSALLDIERTEGRFTELLGWARERLDDALTVEALAARSNMSARNFARAFTAETGVTPAKPVERLRSRRRGNGWSIRPSRSAWRAMWDLAIRSGCGGHSCARSDSRRRRCAVWRVCRPSQRASL